MGIGRREFSQTKVILEGDSAIGPKASYREYLQTWDERYLDLIPGERPTRFLIRQLSPEQRRAIDPLEGMAREELAIRCLLLLVENYEIERADHSRSAPDALVFEDAGAALGRIVSDASIKSLGLTMPQRRALYLVGALHFSEAQLPFSRPSGQAPGPSEPSAPAST